MRATGFLVINVVSISIFLQFIYLPLRITWIEAKKKQKNYLVSHGEEAQKKLAGL